jgi:tetratricopeptide (TPR) repeat protein
MEIPQILIDQIQSSQVILFLGSGASFGAEHDEHKRPPDGQALSDLIARKYLGEDFVGRPLAQVSELAISETDLFSVQDYIATLFNGFYPASFHKLIPKIAWKAIATTNYDLIIERAYDEVQDKIQRLVVFKKNGERIEQRLSGDADLLYLKLHGSITDTHDQDLPLILTPDQYVLYRKNRSRLFDRLTGLSYEFPVVFVGQSLSDQNLRSILLELNEQGEAKPRSYLVNPTITEAETRFWEGRRISPIKVTFEQFLKAVDATIPSAFRSLAVHQPKASHPIFERFASSTIKPSASLLTLLDRDVDYLHKTFRTGTTEPKEFYRGYFPNWDPIEMNLDVKRWLTDAILSEVVLVTEEEKSDRQELIAILGHAGSGKTVILRRLAWDAAIEFGRLCLAVRPSARPEYEAIRELYTLCKERIFLFIDNATEYVDLIQSFISSAKRDKFPLTIVTAERMNEWGVYCERLNSLVTGRYEVKYLSWTEIEQLIKLLTKFKSLNHLEGLSFEEQKEALGPQAGRQLLVALHEATLGKPFTEIVLDEFRSIPSPHAQSLYLSVCILHRLGVVTRAGVISRVHKIPFAEFKERLFKPLEYIVFATENKVIDDYEYRTRHPHIAEIVFETVLVDEQDRYDEYIRILAALDIDYNADRDAFKGMTNARELRTLFPNPALVRSIYEVAQSRSINDPMLFQQEAIFEMTSMDGSLNKATDLLAQARKLAPWSQPIAHSFAELSLRKAERSTSSVERKKLRDESRVLATEIAAKVRDDPHPYHTLIKVGLSELEELLHDDVGATLENKIKDLQQTISRALQLFPEESFILEADSRFNHLIDDHPKAVESLKKAFQQNRRSPFIALRLAKMLDHQGLDAEAMTILKAAVEANPGDKEVNFALAMALHSNGAKLSEIKHYLRRSFTRGDTHYIAQFWYARLLYLEGNLTEARELFRQLSEANIDVEVKRQPRGKILKDGVPSIFHGTMSKLEASYGFITRDNFDDPVFVYRFSEDPILWETLSPGTRVIFEISFNYKGPIALSIRREQDAKSSI